MFASFTVIVLTTGFGDGKNFVLGEFPFTGLFSLVAAFEGLNLTGLMCFAGLNLEGAILLMKSVVASSFPAALVGDFPFVYSKVLGGFEGCELSMVLGALGGCQIFFGFSSCLKLENCFYGLKKDTKVKSVMCTLH